MIGNGLRRPASGALLGLPSHHPVALTTTAPRGAEASNLVLVARRLDGRILCS